MSIFFDNYVSLCAKIQKSPSAVAEAVGLSRTSPAGWKKGKQPSDVNAQKLADYFGVPVSELLEEQKTPTAQGDGLTESQRQLIDFAKTLTEDQAVLALRLLKAAVEAD